jgi:hypothetical protein
MRIYLIELAIVSLSRMSNKKQNYAHTEVNYSYLLLC